MNNEIQRQLNIDRATRDALFNKNIKDIESERNAIRLSVIDEITRFTQGQKHSEWADGVQQKKEQYGGIFDTEKKKKELDTYISRQSSSVENREIRTDQSANATIISTKIERAETEIDAKRQVPIINKLLSENKLSDAGASILLEGVKNSVASFNFEDNKALFNGAMSVINTHYSAEIKFNIGIGADTTEVIKEYFAEIDEVVNNQTGRNKEYALNVANRQKKATTILEKSYILDLELNATKTQYARTKLLAGKDLSAEDKKLIIPNAQVAVQQIDSKNEKVRALASETVGKGVANAVLNGSFGGKSQDTIRMLDNDPIAEQKFWQRETNNNAYTGKQSDIDNVRRFIVKKANKNTPEKETAMAQIENAKTVEEKVLIAYKSNLETSNLLLSLSELQRKGNINVNIITNGFSFILMNEKGEASQTEAFQLADHNALSLKKIAIKAKTGKLTLEQYNQLNAEHIKQGEEDYKKTQTFLLNKGQFDTIEEALESSRGTFSGTFVDDDTEVTAFTRAVSDALSNGTLGEFNRELKLGELSSNKNNGVVDGAGIRFKNMSSPTVSPDILPVISKFDLHNEMKRVSSSLIDPKNKKEAGVLKLVEAEVTQQAELSRLYSDDIVGILKRRLSESDIPFTDQTKILSNYENNELGQVGRADHLTREMYEGIEGAKHAYFSRDLSKPIKALGSLFLTYISRNNPEKIALLLGSDKEIDENQITTYSGKDYVYLLYKGREYATLDVNTFMDDANAFFSGYKSGDDRHNAERLEQIYKPYYSLFSKENRENN